MTPNIANQIITTLNAQIDELAAQVGTLQYEVDAIPAIKEERDALALDVDQWRVDYNELRLEHDALMSAAKLALIQMERNQYLVRSGAPRISAEKFHEVITSLRQAGVQ